MTKLTAGHGSTEVLLHVLTIHLNDSVMYVQNNKPFLANVKYYYEPAIKPDEDSAGCAEYVELEGIVLKNMTTFHDGENSMALSILGGTDISQMLFEYQRDYVLEALRQQHKSVADCYVDFDSCRPEVSKRVKEMLGFNLLMENEYD